MIVSNFGILVKCSVDTKMPKHTRKLGKVKNGSVRIFLMKT